MIKEVKVNFKSRHKKKHPLKTYEYTLRKVSSLRIDNLIEKFGIETTLKLLNNFEGTSIYIPKKQTIRTNFLHTIIRKEAKELIKEKNNQAEVVRTLAKKYNKHIESIYRILGRKNVDSIDEFKFDRRNQINKIRDENLLYILKKYWKELNDNDLV